MFSDSFVLLQYLHGLVFLWITSGFDIIDSDADLRIGRNSFVVDLIAVRREPMSYSNLDGHILADWNEFLYGTFPK